MGARVSEDDLGGYVGFDADGKLRALTWIVPEHGLTDAVAKRETRRGGLAVKKVSTFDARELMIKHGWVKRPRSGSHAIKPSEPAND